MKHGVNLIPTLPGLPLALGHSRVVASGDYIFTNTEAETLVAAFPDTPNDTRKELIDDTVGRLKVGAINASNNWANLSIFYALAADTEGNSLINWKTPAAHALTNVNAVSFVADEGYTGNGTTNYLNTNWNPTDDDGVIYTQNAAHIGEFVRVSTDGTAKDFSEGTAANTYIRGPRNSGIIAGRVNRATGSLTFTDAGNVAPVHLMAARTVSTDYELFVNGIEVATQANVSATLPSVDFNVFRANTTEFSDRQVSLIHAGDGLTANEAVDLHDAIDFYLTGVGAIV